MNTVPSTELKSKLAEYLRLVEEGQSFIVTLRGEPIAKIEPITDNISMETAIQHMDRVRSQSAKLSGSVLKKLKDSDKK